MPARNAGLRQARGDFVAFIDSDDAWRPQRLAAQLPLFARPEVGLVIADARHRAARDGPTRLTSFHVTPPRRGRVAPHFVWGNFVPTVTVLARRRCFDAAGPFSEVALAADYVKWFQIALACELEYVDEPLAEYTVHRAGISHDLGRSLAARIELFADERARIADPEARAVLDRLLFNLGLRLAVSTVRGRAGSVAAPYRLAWRTAGSAARGHAAPWAAAFFLRQARVRAERLFTTARTWTQPRPCSRRC